jgi:4-hydroxybenzoyl-CoA reductase subunit beta
MILPDFELHSPRTLKEALALARRHLNDFDYVAGGTDLLQNYKNRLNCRRNLISLSDLEGASLREIGPGRIGALATLMGIEESRSVHPAVRETAAVVASPLVRQSATLGGNLLVETRCFWFNQSAFWRDAKGGCMKEGRSACLVVPQEEICYATYSGDMAGILIPLGASVHLEGLEGGRDVPLSSFFAHDGIRKNVTQKGEIITHLSIPEGARQLKAGYRKLRIRDSFDYPSLGVSAALRMGKGKLEELHVCVNAVATTPLVFDDLAAGFVGRPFGNPEIERLSEEVTACCQPYKNVALSPVYRRAMIGVFLKRLLTELSRLSLQEDLV